MLLKRSKSCGHNTTAAVRFAQTILKKAGKKRNHKAKCKNLHFNYCLYQNHDHHPFAHFAFYDAEFSVVVRSVFYIVNCMFIKRLKAEKNVFQKKGDVLSIQHESFNFKLTQFFSQIFLNIPNKNILRYSYIYQFACYYLFLFPYNHG